MLGFIPESPDDEHCVPNLHELTITCRDQVGEPAYIFTNKVEEIWWLLSIDLGIEAHIICQVEGTRINLAELYHDQRISGPHWESEENDYIDTEGGSSGTDVTDDHDLPDLIDPMD